MSQPFLKRQRHNLATVVILLLAFCLTIIWKINMAFDVNQFLNTQVEGEMDVDFTLVPEGEYRVSIDDLDAKASPSVEGSVMLTLKLKFPEGHEIEKVMNRSPYIWNYMIFVDVDKNNALLYGANQNIVLGQIREALGMNKPNVAFSLGQLAGSSDMIIKVEHKERKKSKDSDETRALAVITAWGRPA